MPTYPFPINPGADIAAVPPPFITWLPQEADITLVGQKTNCYIIYGTEGKWVVDPPSAKEAQLAEILAVVGENLAGIWLTHAHPDHTGGIAPLVARTGVPVYAHPRAWESVMGDVAKIDVDEGHVVDGWQVHHLPGHRFDHLAFIHQASRVGIVGDVVAGAGSVIIDPGDGDLFDYFTSLHRLRDDLQPTMLLPGHGPISAEPQILLSHFIAHRLKRERMIVEALTETPQPIAALLPLAYADTPTSMYPLAERALLTHLRKLEREGRAVHEAGGWRV
jgi:ribonuclease/clavin/mitogillin